MNQPFFEDDFDSTEPYEDAFNPLRSDRQARRGRRPKAHHIPKVAEKAILSALADELDGQESKFEMTYTPGPYESVWLIDSIKPFYEQYLIRDVLGAIKGGKEASVYRCQAQETTGTDLLAAKIYRPRQFRSLSNDSLYKEGRAILKESGTTLRENERRLMKAINQRSEFGRDLSHESWLLHEYTTLEKLHNLGAAVPKPYAVNKNAILMAYYGDESMAAPVLNQVRLEHDEAVSLLADVLRNIELMLSLNIIHGDLSAYNILYWDGEAILIDFPQVVDSHNNRQARAILGRDVVRVCEYFARQGVVRNAAMITEHLWERYTQHSDQQQLADLSKEWSAEYLEEFLQER